MPRWTFEIIAESLAPSEKSTIAREATKIYTDVGFPKFWVNVFFHENDPNNFYIGADSSKNVFLVINHTARTFESVAHRLGFLDRVDTILRPILEPKGLHWEFNIHEHPAQNWRMNGMIPPVNKPDVLQNWVSQNKPVPY
ncbi:putative oxalocrotonate tautomerase [Fusarium oxysporum Fo47]|uniref:Uncharacterized protein n=1 Tax=Fusarium oxysporum Fo47 TaxID=660027 RepID=W9JAU4_FUSOX|nr:putative oxalocrotonate tautomerase [Fusarium oxysporum Fo47]EWZ28981.1 hypothetical protein FOZG_17280 [Fusarium oxysporum Fo47]QKD57542.1 putative oxalocrotonate tautomerase [Fusarium oxysporum Fo47]